MKFYRRWWRKWKPTDTLFLLAFCVVSALSQIFQPPSIQALLPSWMIYFWSGILLIGALTSTVGHVWSKANPLSLKGLLVEVAGRWMLAPTTLAYASAVLYYSHALLNAIILVSFSLTCFSRIEDINDKVRAWEKVANGLN